MYPLMAAIEWDPLVEAVRMGRFRNAPKMDPLMIAIRMGRLHDVEDLLFVADYKKWMNDPSISAAEKAEIRADYEADLNEIRVAEPHLKMPALAYAALKLKADIVKLLLELGANPNEPFPPMDPDHTLYHQLHETLKVLKAKKMDKQIKTLVDILVMLHKAGGKLTDELMAEPELMSHLAWARRGPLVTAYDRSLTRRSGRRMHRAARASASTRKNRRSRKARK